MISEYAIGAEGAASLRFLRGRVTMLPTQFLRSATRSAHAFQVPPALCKVRKGRGIHYVLGAREAKSLGHPPSRTPPRMRTSLWKAQAVQEVLKARVSPKGIQLGVGGDPGRAVRALVQGFSQP